MTDGLEGTSYLPPEKIERDQFPTIKKLRLEVIVREMDSYHGKRVSDLLFDLFKKNGFEGAIVLRSDRGYDKRGFATSGVLGLSVKLPIIIETVEDSQKVIPLLETIKDIVGANGLITISEVSVV